MITLTLTTNLEGLEVLSPISAAHECTHTQTCTHAHTQTRTHTDMRAHTHTQTRRHTRTHTHTHTCAHCPSPASSHAVAQRATEIIFRILMEYDSLERGRRYNYPPVYLSGNKAPLPAMAGTPLPSEQMSQKPVRPQGLSPQSLHVACPGPAARKGEPRPTRAQGETEAQQVLVLWTHNKQTLHL